MHRTQRPASLGWGSPRRIHKIELSKALGIDRLESPIRALFVSVDGPANPHSFGQLALLEEADDEGDRQIDLRIFSIEEHVHCAAADIVPIDRVSSAAHCLQL